MYKLCKTEQSASRQRQLEKKLEELMNIRRYEEISVSDFCAYAGIPRKAFYRYFSSKDGALYALLDHTMLEFEFFREPYIPGGVMDMQQELSNFFRFWKDHKLLLDALVHSGISGILVERSISSIREGALHIKAVERPEMLSHVIQFAVCGLMVMVVDWHQDGYRNSVQEMTRIALRLVTQPLFQV